MKKYEPLPLWYLNGVYEEGSPKLPLLIKANVHLHFLIMLCHLCLTTENGSSQPILFRTEQDSLLYHEKLGLAGQTMHNSPRIVASYIVQNRFISVKSFRIALVFAWLRAESTVRIKEFNFITCAECFRSCFRLLSHSVLITKCIISYKTLFSSK